MNSGIDLQSTFIESLGDLGIAADLAKVLWMPFPMLLMLIGATLGVFVNVWLERKVSAAAQQRIGPEFAGPLGVLQPVADGLKLLFKEDILPAKADPYLFTLAQWLEADGVDPARIPRVMAHRARMTARPNVRAAITVELAA